MAEYFIVETSIENNGLEVETWEFGPFDSLQETMEEAQGILRHAAAYALDQNSTLTPGLMDQLWSNLLSERIAVLNTATYGIGFPIEER